MVNLRPKSLPSQRVNFRNCIHLVAVTGTRSALQCRLITYKALQRHCKAYCPHKCCLTDDDVPSHPCGSARQQIGCTLYDPVCFTVMAAQVPTNKPIALSKWTGDSTMILSSARFLHKGSFCRLHVVEMQRHCAQ